MLIIFFKSMAFHRYSKTSLRRKPHVSVSLMSRSKGCPQIQEKSFLGSASFYGEGTKKLFLGRDTPSIGSTEIWPAFNASGKALCSIAL